MHSESSRDTTGLNLKSSTAPGLRSIRPPSIILQTTEHLLPLRDDKQLMKVGHAPFIAHSLSLQMKSSSSGVSCMWLSLFPLASPQRLSQVLPHCKCCICGLAILNFCMFLILVFLTVSCDTCGPTVRRSRILDKTTTPFRAFEGSGHGIIPHRLDIYTKIPLLPRLHRSPSDFS